MSLNFTRNLAADQFQIYSTNVISTISFIINILGNYIVINAKVAEKTRFVYLSYHFVLFLSQFYVGTVLNAVILIPVPGIYCIGWLRNASDVMKVVYVALFYLLFGLQGELLAILTFLKIGSVARQDSLFKIRPLLQFIFVSCFVFINHGLHWITFYFTYTTRSELEAYVQNNFPHHGFLLRYPFLWMATSNRLFISFTALNMCSVGLIIMATCMCYIVVLYELERRKSYLSKSAFQEHKMYIDEISSHGYIIFPFFAVIPCCWFVQFFVLEETDVSIPVSVCFLIFVSAPIPAMMSFLWRNPTYRICLLRIFCFSRSSFTQPLAVRTFVQEI